MRKTQAEGKGQILGQLVLVFNVRRNREGMNLAVRHIADLAEAADIAEQHIRDCVILLHRACSGLGGVAIESECPIGLLARILPLSVPQELHARCQIVLPMEPAHVVAERIVQIGCMGERPRRCDALPRSAAGNRYLRCAIGKKGSGIEESLCETRHLVDVRDSLQGQVQKKDIHGDAGVVHQVRRQGLRQRDLRQLVVRIVGLPIDRS